MAFYVVTGGAGFIGSAVVRRLARDGHEVRVVDDLSTGKRANLDGLAGRVALHHGSICDRDLLDSAFAGADFVLHQAAIPSVPLSVEDPLGVNEVNVTGTLAVLWAARDAGVRRVVYASSCSVYGNAPELPKREDMAPAPMSPYAVSKLAGEQYCCAFTEVYGLETVSLRYFNVYGPRQDPSGPYAAVVPMFAQAIAEGRRPRVLGDGEQSRDFVFVEDVAEANVRASTAEGAAGAVLNIGVGERHTLNELLGLLRETMGKPFDVEYAEPRAGDVRHSQADISRARQVIGFEPQVSFGEGVRRTVQWYGG
jgi:nucleoside-diphosphate-sugar epimerase